MVFLLRQKGGDKFCFFQMLKIAAWNIRGLNNPLKQKEISSFVQSQRLSLIGIVETKVRKEHLASTVSHCFPSHWLHYSNIDAVGSTARIILAWDPLVLTVSSLSLSSQMILVKVASVDCHKEFYASVIYGANSSRDRRQLWMICLLLGIGILGLTSMEVQGTIRVNWIEFW